ncbi:MAG: hypothetical protein P3A28_06515 [Gemmatimonadota bacterium]|nr:hypothetical protein [Gemmatimonadota bacterium]
MRCFRLTLLAALGICLSPGSSVAQAAPPQQGPIAVYLDCRTHCDGEFIRTEIGYVNWVRDREVADVQLLITSQDAGAGGDQYTLAFIGLRGFAGRGDTLTFTTNPTTTNDEERKLMVQTMALGLVQFLAHTSSAASLRVSVDAAGGKAAAEQTAPKNDPWKAWVFEIGVNGSVDGEKFYKSRDVNLNLEARRVTEAWKTGFEYSFSYRDNHATVQEFDNLGRVTSEETYTNLQRDWNAELFQIKSVTNHFSLGAAVETAQQTFRNQDLRVMGRAAFEYNLFPYAEATRRELSLRYGPSFTRMQYADTTIFGKISENLPGHFVEVSYRTRQPWGNVNVNLEHRNYFTDASKRTTELNGGFSVRLFKGFNLNGGTGYEWIRDQVYLPAASSNAVDVLLRRRALLTGFRYYTHFGVSYTFGSIFNNVVNPRF